MATQIGGLGRKKPIQGDTPERPSRKGGWVLIMGATKWHWFLDDDGRSLCRRWLKLSRGGVSDTNHNSPDNCRMCAQLRKQW